MKKLTLLLLIVSSIGLFAADVNFNLKGAVQVSQLTNTDTQTMGLGEARATFMAKSGGTTLFFITRLDKLYVASPVGTSVIDYLWVETMTAFGKLSIGKQRLGFANKAGYYRTSTFVAGTAQKGLGIALTTKVAGMGVKVQLLGDVFFLDEAAPSGEGKSSLAALIDTGMPFGLKVGGVFNNDNSTASNTSGMSVYAEGGTSVSGLNLFGQIFWDLSDDAAKAAVFNVFGVTTARQWVNIYADYMISEAKLYGSYLADLNKAVYENVMSAGISYPISGEVNGVIDYTSTKTAAGVESSAITAFIDFAVK